MLLSPELMRAVNACLNGQIHVESWLKLNILKQRMYCFGARTLQGTGDPPDDTLHHRLGHTQFH